MESIEINGFLTIDHAFFEIRKINVLIGAQAQGKSLIAKLAYFFKNFFAENFVASIEKLETKRDIDKRCLIQFEEIFPRYSWATQEFSIVYKNSSYSVTLVRVKSGNKYTLKFLYSSELTNFHKKLTNSYKIALDNFNSAIEKGNKKNTQKRENIFFETMYENVYQSKFSAVLKRPIFIPASRSFFSTLQKNIFLLLASNIDIDPFIKTFGYRYEHSKKILRDDFIHHSETEQTIRKKVDQLINSIVVGEYLFADDQDWIVNHGNRTNLANASSGQQESLPMLLVLKIWPFINGAEISDIFFIEEPEAHLFPTSQKQIISLIATLHNALGHSFFITTHSPYILTAINNLIIGQDALDKAKADNDMASLRKLEKILPADELIRLEDVSAYTLSNGKLESIVDLENRLIGTNLLDAVSNEFDAAFGVAAEILYGSH